MEGFNNMLREIEDRVDSSYRYFSENEVYSQEIIDKGNSFENFMIVMSFLSILLACGLGFLQVFLIKNDLKSKKMY